MIREMTIEDLERVCQIEQEAFSHPWSRDDFEIELLSNPYSLYYVYELDREIVSYIGLWLIYEKAQITTIAVKNKYRGQKISRVLMNHVDRICKENDIEICSLEVRVSNLTAIGLYKSSGFEIKGIRKDYYQDNHEDAYLMVKKFKGD
jgi:[ribosomal protein S18]-alanine N-acetyltransferase